MSLRFSARAVFRRVARKVVHVADQRLGARGIDLRQSNLIRRVVRVLNNLPDDATQHEEIFVSRYGVRELKDAEHGSYSGPGSTVERTEAVCAALPGLLEELNCRVFVDAPCGDFKWMRHVDLPVEKYIGVDVIRELVELNQERFGNAQRSFEHVDLVESVLPRADVVLNRDMLIHLSYRDISRFLSQLRASGCNYLLTSHFPAQVSNSDIRTGDWRPVNLEIAPFHFPAPLQTLDEKYTANPAHSDKCLALWKVEDLPEMRVDP